MVAVTIMTVRMSAPALTSSHRAKTQGEWNGRFSVGGGEELKY